MALTQALAALRTHWPAVRAELAPSVAGEADDLAAGLLADPDRRARLRAALRLVQLLDRALLPEHPVRAALAEGEEHRGPTGTAVLDAELAGFRRVLAELDAALGPTPEEILAAARAILLEAPAYTPAELRRLGGEPTTPGLLRLPLPSGEGIRLPRFQFTDAGRPFPVVLEVNKILDADGDPWGAADWWLRGNGWLGAVPATLVDRPAGALVAAALAESGGE